MCLLFVLYFTIIINFRTWYVARAPLLALHFLDYFSYVPPKGSCGVAVHIEPSNIQPSEVIYLISYEFLLEFSFNKNLIQTLR